jgi:SAM-dependent methyltransferase
MNRQWRAAAWQERSSIYELFVEDRKSDIGFYVDLSDEFGGPVFEIGCGSGRILLEVAKRGHACTGVDFASAMLTRFRRRLASVPEEVGRRVTLVEADVSTVVLAPSSFAFGFFAFGMLGFLIKDGEARQAIANVSKALKPGGVLVVERRNRFGDRYHAAREFDWIKRWPERNAIVTQSHTDLIVDDSKKIRETRYYYEGFDSHGGTLAFQHVVYFREFSSLEVEDMLRSCDLVPIGCFGDYDRRPFSPDQSRLIVVAQRPS